MHAHKQHQAAKEHGCSFASVVHGYASDGHSMSETARILGYASEAAFRRMCSRNGFTQWFRPHGQTNGCKRARITRRGVDTPAMREARAKRSYDTIEYQGVHDTIAGHSRRAGVNVRTAYKRLYRRPGDYDYAFASGSHVQPPDQSNHEWSKQWKTTKTQQPRP